MAQRDGRLASSHCGVYSISPMTTIQTIQAKVGLKPEIMGGRLLSPDVYRGLAVAGMILVDNPGSDEGAYWPIKHAEWNGWTPADLIFPSFLFLVGISLVFSFQSRMRRGDSRGAILSHVFKRSLILIAIGLLVNAMPIYGLDLHTYRFYGVTQRIALCYVAASVLQLWSGWRGQVIALLACLVGYWALLRFVPVPGSGFPVRDIPFMDPNRNLVAWFDRQLFMGHLYNGTRDPEGLLSTIPAIATTILGMLTGHWLRSNFSMKSKLIGMLAGGGAGLVSGLLWGRWFPINKNLWTSLRSLQRRILSLDTGGALLGAGDPETWGRLVHAVPGLRNECHRGLCRRLASLRAGLYVHSAQSERRTSELA